MPAELGQTNDPLLLVPGDIHAVRERVDLWRRTGRELATVRDALRNLTADGVWAGSAAEAFEQKISTWLPGWDHAATAYFDAGSALDGYAAYLDYAQGQASDAIDLWNQGEAQTRSARESAAADLREAAHAASGSPFFSSPVLIQPTFHDPGAATRARAVSLLRSAREGLAEAGDAAAQVLDSGIDWGRIFSFVIGLSVELALDSLRTAGNVIASLGQAFIEHPDTLVEILGGALLLDAGLAGEAGGVVLDATGVGAIAGVPVNIASAGLIATGVGLTSAGVLQAAAHAGSDSAAEPFKKSQNRAPNGRYTGYDGVSKEKEHEALDEMEAKLGKSIERQQVLARVEGGRPTGRYYDGLIENEDGTYSAVEVKTGTSPYRGTDQQKFDKLVSPNNPAWARLRGETIQITKVILREVE